jgi:L-threonylcarbamoyladenylate synthase
MFKTKLSEAIESIKNGDIIVYPTDTQYAFGADIWNNDSIRKVFKIKNRPYNNPIPIAVAEYDDIIKYTYTNKYVKKIFDNFLPGELTIILYKKEKISNIITGGKDKIAIRIPNNEIALKLLKKYGPLTVTSANIHGKKTQDTIEKIYLQFKDNISCYLDYGSLNNNPSTIVDLTYKKPMILRKGKIKLKDILAVI